MYDGVRAWCDGDFFWTRENMLVPCHDLMQRWKWPTNLLLDGEFQYVILSVMME